MADLTTTICNITFPNPIWTAAGPTAADAAILARAAKGGAGGLVTKTLSVQPANVPVPNIHSPFAGSLINAELWSEMEYNLFIENELPRIKALGLPVIASVGYSPQDLEILGRALEKSGLIDAVEFSIHYVEKGAENLKRTAVALKENVSVPVFAKLSPSISDVEAVVSALESHVDGYIAINSLGPALDFDIHTLQPYLGSDDGRGWLSGRAILPVGLHFVALLSQLTEKPVIGVGGIRHVIDVIKYLFAGASAVQVCSYAILKGQYVYGELASQLAKWMEENGYPTIESMRGAFHKREKQRPKHLGEHPKVAPAFIKARCNYCNLCVKSCVHQAIHFVNDEFVVDIKKCVSCGLCASLCPKNALEIVPVSGE